MRSDGRKLNRLGRSRLAAAALAVIGAAAVACAAAQGVLEPSSSKAVAHVDSSAESSQPGAGVQTSLQAKLSRCVSCHGETGNAPAPSMPSIAGQPRVFLENQLVLIREGLREVPDMRSAMEGLSDEDISAMARYFSQQPVAPPAVALQPMRFDAGAELSARGLCGSCHRPDYAGQNQVPRLAYQHETYLLATLKMYRDNPGPGRDTMMSGVLRGLKDADLENLAHYLARGGR